MVAAAPAGRPGNEASSNVARQLQAMQIVTRKAASITQPAPVADPLSDTAVRLQLALSAARLGDWSWDVTTDTMTLSPRAAEIFGMDARRKKTAAALRESLHPDDREPARRAVDEALATRSDYDRDYRVRRREGGWKWVASSGRGLYGPDGRLLGMIGVVQDITVRKQHEEAAAREAQVRAETERALAASEQRYREVVEGLHVAIYTVDAAGRITLFNKAAAALWGREPVIGQEHWCGSHRIYRTDGSAMPFPECPMALALQENRPIRDIEIVIERPDGTRRNVQPCAQPLHDAEGRVSGAINLLLDVTELKRTERELRENETRLRLATQSARVGIWDWNIAENRVTWTDSLYEIYGVKRDQHAGTPEAFAALVHPEDRGPVQRALQSSVEHGVPYELEFRAVRPGGAVVWLLANAVVMRENGRAVRMLGATFDVTARKHAELGLRESEARFRALASHAPVGIFLSDTKGDALFVNDTWRALAGLPAEHVRGRAWLDALHPEDRKRIAADWYAAVQQRRPFTAEYRFQRPDGTVSWLQGSAVEFRQAAGALLGYIGTIVDITPRKLAEDALRDSEKRFRTLASHAPVGIFLTDPQGDTVFVNESWCAMAGLTGEAARGRGWARAMHPDDRVRVAAEWSEALAQNRSSSAEYRFVRPDGTIKWVQGNAVQLRDDGGRLVGYIGTVADFTERKAVEERLQARESQLRLITTNAPIILAHCDREERYLFVNRAYTERFGRTPDDVIGLTIRDVLGSAAREALAPYIQRVLSGESVTFETEVPYAGMSRRYMRVAYTPDIADDGRVRSFFCAIADVTDRRGMENALRDSEARFRQLADSMPQIVFSADGRGVTDYYNRRWYDFTGLDEGGSSGEGSLSVVHPDDRQRCLETWYASVKSGEPYQVEYRIRARQTGEFRWHLGRALPMPDASGRVVRWFGTCTDIHDWKLVQDQLRKAQAQLQAHAAELEQRVADRTASLREAIVQMEEFSYSVSHDLRAPLRAMNAYAQALSEDYGAQLDDTARGYLERIQRSSVRMEKLTHDVLNYSRVARAEMEVRELNLEVLLRDIILQYAELQSPAAEVEVIGPLHGVRGHESSLAQCLANLLTNAVKFVAPGVRPSIRVRTEPAGDRVRVWIEDNGIGIAPEYQARLFRVFERVPTRHTYAGTGIGLSIVRRATEKMGGACGVESDGCTGSRFWIELPQASP